MFDCNTVALEIVQAYVCMIIAAAEMRLGHLEASSDRIRQVSWPGAAVSNWTPCTI